MPAALTRVMIFGQGCSKYYIRHSLEQAAQASKAIVHALSSLAHLPSTEKDALHNVTSCRKVFSVAGQGVSGVALFVATWPRLAHVQEHAGE